jgi:RNA polymerase sigma-70 factor (ECF subfamily)
MINKDDLLLIEKYLKGDEKSLEILIQRYLKPIYSFAYKYVGNSQEAEDITQEVFIKVWRNLKKFDKNKNFKPWIFSIAKNTAIDFFKKKKTIPFSQLSTLETIIDSSPLPEELLERKNMLGTLAKVLNKLLPKYSKVLFLRHHNDLTFREISQWLNEPLNTVKSRHRRAVALLKKLLNC